MDFVWQLLGLQSEKGKIVKHFFPIKCVNLCVISRGFFLRRSKRRGPGGLRRGHAEPRPGHGGRVFRAAAEAAVQQLSTQLSFPIKIVKLFQLTPPATSTVSPATAVFIVLAISAAVGSLFFAAFGLAVGGGECMGHENRKMDGPRSVFALLTFGIGKMSRNGTNCVSLLFLFMFGSMLWLNLKQL